MGEEEGILKEDRGRPEDSQNHWGPRSPTHLHGLKKEWPSVSNAAETWSEIRTEPCLFHLITRKTMFFVEPWGRKSGNMGLNCEWEWRQWEIRFWEVALWKKIESHCWFLQVFWLRDTSDFWPLSFSPPEHPLHSLHFCSYLSHWFSKTRNVSSLGFGGFQTKPQRHHFKCVQMSF